MSRRTSSPASWSGSRVPRTKVAAEPSQGLVGVLPSRHGRSQRLHRTPAQQRRRAGGKDFDDQANGDTRRGRGHCGCTAGQSGSCRCRPVRHDCPG
jgi:hypothetical protein